MGPVRFEVKSAGGRSSIRSRETTPAHGHSVNADDADALPVVRNEKSIFHKQICAIVDVQAISARVGDGNPLDSNIRAVVECEQMAPFAPFVARLIEIVTLAHRKRGSRFTPDNQVRDSLRIEHFASRTFVRTRNGAHLHVLRKDEFKVRAELHRVDAPVSARRIHNHLFRARIDRRLERRSGIHGGISKVRRIDSAAMRR